MEWPIVVDESVRDRIADRVESQRARVQLIVGASGIGKSTLASAVSARLEASGFSALPVIGMPELREIPLGALAPLLASTGAPPPSRQATGCTACSPSPPAPAPSRYS